MHENYIAFTHDGELSTVSLSSADSLKHIRNSKILSNIDADSISVIENIILCQMACFKTAKRHQYT